MATTTTLSSCMAVLLLMFVAPALSKKSPEGPLWYEFYNSSCPNAEEEVNSVVRKIISEDPTMGAAFLNLFFHDCFLGGCDASILLNPPTNNRLRGLDAVNKVKAAVELECPGVVSCADILAFAARDSALISGGFGFPMPAGRRDGRRASNKDDASMPSHTDQARSLVDSFAARGFSVADLVALLGAHSFGVTHCDVVADWLGDDSTMNATLKAKMRKVCGSRNPRQEVSMNQVTDPNRLSNQYFKNVAAHEVLLASDQHLMDLNATATKVAYYAANPLVWMAQFAMSMVKMGSIGVLTGNNGEIRRFCNVTNS